MAEPPLEHSGCKRMKVILYQLALVSRELTGSPGREACACGPARSLAEVVSARLTGRRGEEEAWEGRGGADRREGNEEWKEKGG